MKLIKRQQIKPAAGYSAFLHILLVAVLPLILYALVRLDFIVFAFIVVVLSKWRMFAIRLRHWPSIIRSNAVDLLVGFSTVVFMSLSTNNQSLQLLWALVYIGWLLIIKPRSTTLMVGVQALIAQAMALVAIFLVWSDSTQAVLTFSVGVVAYLCSRHFLAAYDEAMSRATAYCWAFFCAGLTWLSSHWLLFYGPVSQPALIITVVGYGMAALYYLDHRDKLTGALVRQFSSIMIVIIMFILIFSDWSGDII